MNMKKILYNFIGGTSLLVGILGVFLPLLPTTCFVILATWAFAKSSPALHAWLYYKSPFAESIQNWQQFRVIPIKIKWMASISITVSFVITIILVSNHYVLTITGAGLLLLIIYLLSQPSHVKKESIYQHTPEWHQQVM